MTTTGSTGIARAHILGRAMTIDEWCRIWEAHAEGAIVPELPALPPPDIQQITNSCSGGATMRAAARVYRILDEEIRQGTTDMSGPLGVLDYGAGWGRITRLMLRNVPPERLHAVDVDECLVNSGRRLLPGLDFRRIQPGQKLPFEDGRFDVVFTISVLSHLSERAHEHCVGEFARVLCPGGLLIATTAGTRLYDSYLSDPKQHKWITEILGRERRVRARLKKGRFVYGATKRWPDYGMAVLPEGWVSGRWRELGVGLLHTRYDYPQDVHVARRARAERRHSGLP